MTIEQPRQPKGAPTGGQFAGTTRTEASSVHLAPAQGPDRVADVDEVILATQQEVRDALRVVQELGDKASRLDHEGRTARRAKDDWDARHWGKPAEPAPQHLLDELGRVEQAKAALRAQAEEAHEAVAAARARVRDLANHYPWAGTGTPVIRFVGGLERPLDVAPSGRFAFYDFPPGDPRHGAIGIATPAAGQWGPYESVTADRVGDLTEPDGSASFAAQDYVDYRVQMTAEDVQALQAFATGRDPRLGAAA